MPLCCGATTKQGRIRLKPAYLALIYTAETVSGNRAMQIRALLSGTDAGSMIAYILFPLLQ